MALAWAMEHDPEMALQLAVALAWWWFLQARLAGNYPLLCHAAGPAPDTRTIPDGHAQAAEQELLAAERYAAAREASAHRST